ncbi:hypothetical protein D3C86_2023690 [compost metagenome]
MIVGSQLDAILRHIAHRQQAFIADVSLLIDHNLHVNAALLRRHQRVHHIRGAE